MTEIIINNQKYDHQFEYITGTQVKSHSGYDQKTYDVFFAIGGVSFKLENNDKVSLNVAKKFTVIINNLRFEFGKWFPENITKDREEQRWAIA